MYDDAAMRRDLLPIQRRVAGAVAARNPAAAVAELCATAEKLLANAAKAGGGAADERYRSIRRDNPAVQKRILAAAGGEHLLLALGWEETADGFRLPRDADFGAYRQGLSLLREAAEPGPAAALAGVTGLPPAEAARLLRACGDDAERAADAFFAGNPASPAVPILCQPFAQALPAGAPPPGDLATAFRRRQSGAGTRGETPDSARGLKSPEEDRPSPLGAGGAACLASGQQTAGHPASISAGGSPSTAVHRRQDGANLPGKTPNRVHNEPRPLSVGAACLAPEQTAGYPAPAALNRRPDGEGPPVKTPDSVPQLYTGAKPQDGVGAACSVLARAISERQDERTHARNPHGPRHTSPEAEAAAAVDGLVRPPSAAPLPAAAAAAAAAALATVLPRLGANAEAAFAVAWNLASLAPAASPTLVAKVERLLSALDADDREQLAWVLPVLSRCPPEQLATRAFPGLPLCALWYNAGCAALGDDPLRALRAFAGALREARAGGWADGEAASLEGIECAHIALRGGGAPAAPPRVLPAAAAAAPPSLKLTPLTRYGQFTVHAVPVLLAQDAAVVGSSVSLRRGSRDGPPADASAVLPKMALLFQLRFS
ncbi:hypothetical protein DIPPA_04289 [Diplonema papillatum]|nr:hypothetical protein DIPPA_04289 [Diplonema papillatum]